MMNFKKNRRIKKLNNLKKKYKGIYLTFLVVISFILNNYNVANLNKTENDGDLFSYYLNTSYYYSDDKLYIYVKDATNEEIKKKIYASTTVEIEGDYFKLYSWSEPIAEYYLIRLDLSNYYVNGKSITVDKKIEYNEFIDSINTNVSCKIFKENEEITSGYITSGMSLKLYYKEDLIDSYDIIVDIKEYVDLGNLNVNDNKIILNDVTIVKDFIDLIDTTGNIIVYDKEGKLLTDSDKLTTCSVVQIELSNTTYKYNIVLVGDVTGSGNIFIGDVSKLYQYFMGTIEMDACYVFAGDVTYDNNIDISDISKLYQYFMGTIASLN